MPDFLSELIDRAQARYARLGRALKSPAASVLQRSADSFSTLGLRAHLYDWPFDFAHPGSSVFNVKRLGRGECNPPLC
jgi:hypothetical protein